MIVVLLMSPLLLSEVMTFTVKGLLFMCFCAATIPENSYLLETNDPFVLNRLNSAVSSGAESQCVSAVMLNFVQSETAF